MWDFFRFVIPLGLFVFGWFLSTQKFAQLMNYDVRIVGSPTMIGEYEAYSIIVYIAAVAKYIVNEDFVPFFLQSFIPMIVCTVIGLVFVFVWGILRMINANKRNIHGTARFASKKDLKENGLLAKSDGVILAQLDSAKVSANKKNNTALQLNLKKQAQFIEHSGKANTLLLAPTGSGKGVGVLIPTLLNYKGSMIIFDPKGENYNITAGYRKGFSRVIRFAPLSEFTARFNPVMAIRDGDEYAFSDANLIADIIFAPAKAGSQDETSQYFSNSARNMVTTVLLHLRFCPDIAPEEKNIAGVLRYLTGLDEEKSDDEENENEENGKDEKWKQIIESKHYYEIHIGDKTQKILAPKIHKIIAQGATRAMNQNSKEKASTYSTVFSKLQLFEDPMLSNATSHSDFEIEDFIHCEEPISLYLIVPYAHVQRIAPVFKLLISFMLKKLSDGETQHGSVKLKNHLIFMLDEFPVLGNFPDIAQVMGVLRGYGINFIIVCQALSQLIDIYGQNHPFLDHCVVQVVYAPGSTKDAEEFSNAIGNETFSELKISSSGRRFSGSSNLNFNDNSSGRRLLDVADLKRLGSDKCLVLAHGMQPYVATKCVYYQDSRFKEKLNILPPQNLQELYKELAGLPSVQRRKTAYLKNLEKQEKEKVAEQKADVIREFLGREEGEEYTALFDENTDDFENKFEKLNMQYVFEDDNQLLQSAITEDYEKEQVANI
ncbi:MAG: type IV secretory system conjugative DNA transfer family protein [Spirochaetales bacterium]